MIEIELGNSININATLFDGSVSKFLRARVYNNSFLEVSGSPFTLSHVSNGTYSNSSFAPTLNGVYVAIVEVYEDAGFSTLSIDYNKGKEVYLVNSKNAKINQIISDIDNAKNLINDNIDTNEGNAV